jgi:hypothetical protein
MFRCRFSVAPLPRLGAAAGREHWPDLWRVPGHVPMLTSVDGGECDPFWEAFVVAMLAAGPARERPSRYGSKPALYIESREVAHREAPGIIDLRITRQGWAKIKDEYAGHPAVHRDPSRRDWIELRPRSLTDLDDLTSLLGTAVAANT